MNFFEWDDNCNVNVEELDAQHKIWLELINHVYDEAAKGGVHQQLDKIIKKMINYGRYHLKFEEELLAQHKYPNYKHHKKLHEEFEIQIKRFQQKINQEGFIHIPDIIKFLVDWFIDHIKSEDKQYSTFLNSKGIR